MEGSQMGSRTSVSSSSSDSSSRRGPCPRPGCCGSLPSRLVGFVPPTGTAAAFLSILLGVVCAWFGCFVLSDGGRVMLPGGGGFALLVLLVASYVGGSLAEVVKLPALVGMLAVGVMLRNVPGIKVGEDLNSAVSAKLRTAALLVILARAGLSLDPKALYRLSLVVIRLALIPCVVEAIAAGIVAKFVLGMPWTYAFMLGFVLAGVSPAVVVPCLLTLQERQFGVAKGIPTLIVAAASIDNVVAITGFGVVFGITFSQGGLAMKILDGPLEVLGGIIVGMVFGALLWYLPAKDSSSLVPMRCALLGLTSVVALFGGRLYGVQGFGALATLVTAFVAAYGWRESWKERGSDPVAEFYSSAWRLLFQPLLFGLIGAEIDVSKVKTGTIGYGIVALSAGLAIRLTVTYLVSFGVKFNWKEKVFIAVSWLPKATVQAALASIVMDHAKEADLGEEIIGWGGDILTIAVVSIFATAPIGAAGIMLLGPRLLVKGYDADDDDDLNVESLEIRRIKTTETFPSIAGAEELASSPPIVDSDKKQDEDGNTVSEMFSHDSVDRRPSSRGITSR